MANADEDEQVARQVPAPKENLTANIETWVAGKPIYRIHSSEFTATQFNPGLGKARFSPMRNGVPTLYGGVSTGVAIMETVFHDLPADSAGIPFDSGRLAGKVHSVIRPVLDLNLVDLNPKTLRKMGVKRSELLDSPPEQYAFTQEYSLAIYHAHPDAHGLQWSSRQHGDTALMLFGDRITSEQLEVEIESESILGSDSLLDLIEAEADQLGVVLIEPYGGDEP
ncbi:MULTISPECIES: RES family NAD+ phosphorylase [Raoultella]|uniref:RES family NAD+ phosphorylase n=1 Tax=Raoultella lignicola TaxID=3040939 RepID=A0ABU9FDS2_9ENTR|nr:RES family NAD+ phosphorylase [Raoultella sp. RIT712]MRT49800.1 RES domain-containing protein [Raoultella sp. RIT712]